MIPRLNHGLPGLLLAAVFLGGPASAQRNIPPSTDAEGNVVEIEITDPEIPDELPPPEIEPAFSRLPANHLKFYLHFGTKMTRGVAFQHLELFEISRSGKIKKPVLDPFREVELWDVTGKRMTLWLHPGRQKPGVNLNVEFGAVLDPEKRYRLVVSRAWQNENGVQPLGDGILEFETTDPDKKQPDPESWKIIPVSSAPGKAVLKVDLGDERIDPVSFRKFVIFRLGETPIPFEADFGEAERGAIVECTLRPPRNEGPVSRIHLVVDPELEDLAGNSVARPFNLDLEANPNFKPRTEPVVRSIDLE